MLNFFKWKGELEFELDNISHLQITYRYLYFDISFGSSYSMGSLGFSLLFSRLVVRSKDEAKYKFKGSYYTGYHQESFSYRLSLGMDAKALALNHVF